MKTLATSSTAYNTFGYSILLTGQVKKLISFISDILPLGSPQVLYLTEGCGIETRDKLTVPRSGCSSLILIREWNIRFEEKISDFSIKHGFKLARVDST